jgi:hypothetical protein
MILWECNGCFKTVEDNPHSHSDTGGKIEVQGPHCEECDIPMDPVEDLSEPEEE